MTRDLKVQLVHSMIFSHIDYCNAVFSLLSEANLNKLQKIQYEAVVFICDLKGKERFQSLSPFLQKLHFLPVRFRIKYKVALMTFKCINNIAPRYLSDMIALRVPNKHSLRKDNDFFLLTSPSRPSRKRTEGAFTFSAPNIWNCLPYSIRCISDLSCFKKALKTHFFTEAFKSN